MHDQNKWKLNNLCCHIKDNDDTVKEIVKAWTQNHTNNKNNYNNNYAFKLSIKNEDK